MPTAKKAPKHKPLKLGLTGFRRHKKIQMLLGSTPEFNAFFRLGRTLLAEQRNGQSVNVVELTGIRKRRNALVGEATLKLATEINLFSRKHPLSKIIGKRRYGKITYNLSPFCLQKGHLTRAGIGTRLLVALEEIAREKNIQILFGTVAPVNKISIRAMRKRGFQKLKNTNYYYKVLK